MTSIIARKVINNSQTLKVCSYLASCRFYRHKISLTELDELREHPLNRHKQDVNQVSPERREDDRNLPQKYAEVFPDFLPNPSLARRDNLMEKLERRDMYRRRRNINIPEFYVGSILAVTIADKYTPGKCNRFLGLCIKRDEYGLRHTFTLRNVINEQGVEVTYEMYNPLIRSIQVILLEKRLDKELFYLRDCPQEYSFFPQDMQPEDIYEGREVPVNTIKVPLNQRPWQERWDRHELQGIEEFTDWKTERSRTKAEKSRNYPQNLRPWEKEDIVKHYRETINPAESKDILTEVKTHQEKEWDDKDIDK